MATKIKIDYISDLHLDFHIPFTHNQEKWKKQTKDFIFKLLSTTLNKEVICIAGDFSHYNRQTIWALQEFATHYDKVIITYGNHDMYLVSGNQAKKYGEHSGNRIKELYKLIECIDNVIPLFSGSDVCHYQGVRFAGNPMWYPLATESQLNFFTTISNDSRLIKGSSISLLHEESAKDYYNILAQQVDVMISHMPVIETESHQTFGGSDCYYTPVDEVNAKHWIMGHVHERRVYQRDSTTFYINAVGYPSDKLGQETIQSFKI